jgi:integrase
MPRRPKAPRLWLREGRRDKQGRITHAAAWVILDGGRQFSTGCAVDDIDGANQALVTHINKRHGEAARSKLRQPDRIPIADVLALYAKDVAPNVSNPTAAAHRLKRLGTFFKNRCLSDINGPLCRQYAEDQDSPYSARRDLEDLSSAIGHHMNEGLHNVIVKVWKPEPPPRRERWLTRSEAARLIWEAWRHREIQHGERTAKRTRQHLARFMLVALYTGSRASVIAQAALQPESDRPYVDTERGIYRRRSEGERETNKRKPTISLPPRLLAHMRRWKRLGFRYVVEWAGKPVSRITSHTFRKIVADAGLGRDVVPHIFRHTAATWLMQAAADPWQSSGFLGMSMRTLEKNYGHHHPDYFDSVHGAFYRHRTANASPTNDVNRARTFVGERKAK